MSFLRGEHEAFRQGIVGPDPSKPLASVMVLQYNADTRT